MRIPTNLLASPARLSRGFSLLELLVVLAIMSVLVAASVPVLESARNSYRLVTARDELVGAIETMRTYAIKQESETRLTVAENGVYTMQFEQNGTLRVMRYSLPPDVTFTLPAGVTSLTILCRPTGKVTMTGNTGGRISALTLSNAAGQRTVNVSLLGHITAALPLGPPGKAIT
jgi:prepilin-type N-terminal cleavage/methylation domain-containing protein